jgi:hypothetical protein
MPRISVTHAELRDPMESGQLLVALEEALFCDGSECGCTVYSEDGELELLPPHWHSIFRGKSPDAGPRRDAIWGDRHP